LSVKTPPRKPPNAARRSWAHLLLYEVDQAVAATQKVGRHPVHDATLILLMSRHGLRVAEAIAR
jgi:type 1 fimbriae regulatory protein FimB